MKLFRRFFIVFVSLFLFSHFLCAEVRLSKKDFNLFKVVLKKIGNELKKIGDKKLVKEAFKGYGLSLDELVERLPVVKDIPLPDFITKPMSRVALKTPRITEEDDSYELTESISFGDGQDIQLRIYAGPGKKGVNGISCMIGIPGEWTLNDLIPDVKKALLKLEEKALPEDMRKTLKQLNLTVEDFAKIIDWLVFSDIGFGFGAPSFEDPVYGKMMSGLNVFCNIKLVGPFEKITSIFGKDLASLQYRGFLSPLLGNSEVRAVYPGKVSFLRIPLSSNSDPFFHIRSSDLQFRVGLTDKLLPTIKGIGGFEILLPFHDEYIKFLTSIDFMGVKADISGYTEGLVKNIFGMRGVNVGNLGFVLTLTPQPPPIPPIGGFGLQGELHFGKAKLKTLFKGDVRGDFSLIASAKSEEGSITNKDVIDFVLGVIDGYAKIGKVKADVKKLKPLFSSVMLPFEIGDLEVYIVPTGIEVFNIKYARGIYLEGSVSFPSLSLGGGIKAQISMSGVEITHYLDAINLPKKKPIISITGDSSTGGPIFSNVLTLSKQVSVMSCQVEIPPLGIKEKLHAKVGLPEGFDFEMQRKFGGLFDMTLHIVGNPKSLDTFYVEGYCKQEAINKFSNLLKKEINKVNKKAQEDLKKAKEKLSRDQYSVKKWEIKGKQDIDKWIENEKNKLQKPIDKIKEKIEKAKYRCKKSKWFQKSWKCAEMALVPGYYTVQKSLELAKKVGLDKILRGVAKEGIKFMSSTARFGIQTAKNAVSVSQKAVKFSKDISDFITNLISKGFNITSIEVKKQTLKDLVKSGNTVPIKIKGKVLGRNFCQVYYFDFKKPELFFKQVAAGLIQIFGPKKTGKAFADACKAMNK